MKNPVKRVILVLNCSLILLAGIFFDSCSSEDKSLTFMKAMETVDIYIKNGEVNDALKLLKKSEKKAFSSYARLGIYKRYVVLGEDKSAEKVLDKAYKKLPENLEISAVYGNHLLRKNKISEALKVTEILEGTKYGAIHSEAMLKLLLNKENLTQNVNPLLQKEVSAAYYDIYAGTDDPLWLRNCALIYLMGGDYSMAASLQQEIPETPEDALFWGFVQYDSGNYDVAVKNLRNVNSDLLGGIASSLASDAYMMLDDSDGAEEVRREYMDRAKKYVKISPALSVNSALWAYSHKEYRRAYDLLINAIFDYPDYVPALISYGKLALEDSKPVEMSDLERSLRKTELRTGKMRDFDDRPKFTVEDAVYRMGELLEKEGEDNNFRTDDLIVERLDLFLRQNEEKSLTFKTATVWTELEKNEIGTNLYPSHLVQYCVQKFLSWGLREEARSLFTNYITKKFALNYEEQNQEAEKKVETDIFGGQKIVSIPVVPEFIARLAFGDRAALAAERMEIWEVEFAAYFALLDGNIGAAKRLYEYVNFETGGAKTANASGEYISVSPLAASSSSANLGMIYSSQGESKKALSLYSLAAGRTPSKKNKSKLLYRIAKLQMELGRIQDAKVSASYSISLDSGNADSKLLLRQIKQK